ncbi:TlyA family RNA methyltransferase [Leucobacter edaphi]|uniref:TlyA family RNA methyltransferase n=1 Tax=Leucobacter edaphi TaxID=2796472 RepID=UPI0034E28306
MAPERREVWNGEASRLDRALAELGLARSRSRAAELISEGRVRVDGVVVTKHGYRVRSGAALEIEGEDHYVGRAAHKLIAGLDRFAVNPAGRLALDLGASTGGFTQVLLERGAEAVQAIDVGHDQLAPELARDARVRLVEGRNARDLSPENLAADTGIAAAPSLVVADLSFISLTLVLPAIAAVIDREGEAVLLIKPQFEVGRVRDGVVTDPDQWREAILKVLAAARETPLVPVNLAVSPVVGGTGNREFLIHLSATAAADGGDPAEWERRIAEVVSADPVSHAHESRGRGSA